MDRQQESRGARSDLTAMLKLQSGFSLFLQQEVCCADKATYGP
jgi:hypothetical protein